MSVIGGKVKTRIFLPFFLIDEGVTKPKPQDFFQQRRSLPEIKQEVFPRLLSQWAEIVLTDPATPLNLPVSVTDLSAGLGVMAEGATSSAAGQLLKAVVVSAGIRADLNKRARLFFHDPVKALLSLLQTQVAALPFFTELQNPPQYLNQPDDKILWQETLASGQPALFFLDPLGSKFSQEVWSQALEHAHADVVFFLVPNRLKAAVRNGNNKILSLFLGDNHQKIVQALTQNTSSHRKEEALMQAFEQALAEKGYRLTKFKINVPGKDQTDAYLCLASSRELLHTRFKEILIEYSERQEDGVPRLGAYLKPLRLLVPEFHKFLPFSLDRLEQDLLLNAAQFHRMALNKIYERHNVGTPYSLNNYFTVVEKLVLAGKVTLINPKTGQTVRKLNIGCRVKFTDQ